jgi:branched-subunit amino acid transport protein
VNLWLIVVAAGLGTFAIRLSMLVFVHHSALPPFLREALRFVSPAVLAAIILPAVLYVGEGDRFSAGAANERMLAALIAAAVAWSTRNVWLTIGVGMTALWALKGLGV